MNLKRYIKQLKHGGFRSFLGRAHAMGVEITLIEEGRLDVFRLRYKGKALFCIGSNIPLFRRMGNLSKDKNTTKKVLEDVGIRTPRGILVTDYREIAPLLRKEKLSFPLITKPVDGSLAKGVTWNIQSLEELKAGFHHAKGAYGKRAAAKILVEEMIQGNEYRVLVFNGRVLSCVQKIPAGVTGDGSSTIQKLIHRFNKGRVKGFEIKLDAVAKKTLREHGLTLKSVLPKGQFFKFRNNLNMSDGGRSVEVTGEMSPALKKICVRAVQAVGLTYGGLDLITPDLSSMKKGYAVLEVNPHPFYNMHEKPLVEGKGVDVSEILLKSLFSV